MARKRSSKKAASVKRKKARPAATSSRTRVTGRAAHAAAPRSSTSSRRPATARKKAAAGARTPAPRRSGRVVTLPDLPAGIPERQWNLPAGFTAGSGRAAALKKVVDPHCRTVDGPSLDEAQRCELTLKRIARQRTFEFRTLDGQTLSKRRALAEVRQQTPLGRTLIDIEHRTISLLCEWIRSQQRDAVPPETAGIRAADTSGDAAFRALVNTPAAGTPAARARARRVSAAAAKPRAAARSTRHTRQGRSR